MRRTRTCPHLSEGAVTLFLAEGLEEVCWLEEELWDDAWLDDA
ncbi:MAG: hypothetical protein V8Q30_07260 [Acutalibacteraceae bacterium]